jgi:hypothetical protein
MLLKLVLVLVAHSWHLLSSKAFSNYCTSFHSLYFLFFLVQSFFSWKILSLWLGFESSSEMTFVIINFFCSLEILWGTGNGDWSVPHYLLVYGTNCV